MNHTVFCRFAVPIRADDIAFTVLISDRQLKCPDKAFAVFLAEPVSDFAAATVTTITFFAFFRKLLKKSPQA
jgi:hypothetical protein